MEEQKIKILISGGAGFVGSHLTLELAKLGHKITIIDDFSGANCTTIDHPNVEILNHSITTINKKLNYDTIFHLAAKPFSKSKHDWFYESQQIFNTNTTGTFNILRLANPKAHFIFASSASVYGKGCKIPETFPYNPLSAYGYSKAIAEQIILNTPRIYTILRPATIIGPRGRCFPNRIMWSLFNKVSCDFFSNGNVLRDIIDVRDVVTALIKLMNGKVFGIFNLGTNQEIKGKDLISIAKQIGKEKKLNFEYKLTPFTPEDFVLESTLNSYKLHSTLHWRPQFTLNESLRTIFDHYQNDPKAKEPVSWESL